MEILANFKVKLTDGEVTMTYLATALNRTQAEAKALSVFSSEESELRHRKWHIVKQPVSE